MPCDNAVGFTALNAVENVVENGAARRFSAVRFLEDVEDLYVGVRAEGAPELFFLRIDGKNLPVFGF